MSVHGLVLSESAWAPDSHYFIVGRMCSRSQVYPPSPAASSLAAPTVSSADRATFDARTGLPYSHVRALREQEKAGVTHLLAAQQGPPSSLSSLWRVDEHARGKGLNSGFTAAVENVR